MKSGLIIGLFLFLTLGILINSTGVLAQDNSTNNTNDNSGSDSEDSNDSVNDSDDEDDEDDEDDNPNRSRFRTREREFTKEVELGNGGRIEIERRTEVTEEGVKTKIKRKITDINGNTREITIIIERSEDGMRKEIRIEGSDIEVETDLEIDDELEDNETDIEAIDSEGKRHKIKIMPDRASEIAIERLRAKNFTIELREIEHRNIPRVVYHIQANKTGRFLGVYKLALKIETEVDPETGETITTSKPWWAFLVAGEDSDQTDDDDENDNQGDSNQTNQTTQININLGEQNNSGESGTATLTEEENQVVVAINMIGFMENVSQPAHIHLGACPDVGAVAYPLENVLNGESETTINITFGQLESELPLGINIHKSVENASIYTACGDILFD